MKKLILAVSLAMIAAGAAQAGPPPPKAHGIEDKSYKWNAEEGEKMEALKLKGDKVRGEEGYEVCGACHLPSGAGRPDGTFPQLAGQHTTVLIKQMADIRAGLRDNPTMYPFAATLIDPQELADVAVYIEGLCIPIEHGKYEGPDAAVQLATGKTLYEKECKECHGANGEGVKDKFYPVIAGQHYKYLLRQMTEIRDGHRRNANPDMVKIIKKYDDKQLVAISAYQSSLVMPGNMCKPKATAKK
ncbi:MAG: Cytochrome c4 precursor [Candidatus Accumulibacter appositus]|uniref:Cytochrome c4 n=1 Tax=Candidatus Accumulibacter appositus TaxID=1454003 RepID=A0A011NHY3_9PROT|nr:c-type cytochrome [Accumulibacter sp.]EXI82388.1 MAG: Cytochrome c4 precursor [Candidatus Accumulibacter appositus]HRF03490.1 c-type cytochrome [Accumulibacter sp.]